MGIFVVFRTLKLAAMLALGPTLNSNWTWKLCQFVSDSLCCALWVDWLWVSLSFRLFILTTPNCQRKRWVTEWFHSAYMSDTCLFQLVNSGETALHNAHYNIILSQWFSPLHLFLPFECFLQSSLCLFQKTSICYLSFPDSNSGELLFLLLVWWNIDDGHLWLKNSVN